MYEVFDLNGKSVFKIEPANGMISYLYHGIATVETLKVGDKRKLLRDGTITSVTRDTMKTFLVELEIETEKGCGNIIRQYCSPETRESRITIFGSDSDGDAKRAFDLVSKDGKCFIETKDTRGRKITASAEYINKAMGRLLQRGIS